MTWIIKIQFGKSRSASYSDIVKLAQGLPNYSEINGVINCGAMVIREYIMYHTEFETLMWLVEKWKSSRILLFDKEYRVLSDFWKFRDRATVEAGKYAPLLQNGEVGANSLIMEDLPYPIVYYPSLYGAFFAFAKDIDTEIFFCECERAAIENYIELRKQSPLKHYTGSKTYPLGSDCFSELVAEKSRETPSDPLAQFKFKPNLCHRCNNRLPHLKYCLDMYAEKSKFKQTYGWFINQEYFHCGIDLYQEDNILIEKCPPEILDFKMRRTELQRRLLSAPDDQETQDELAIYNREFHNSIENKARESLGFKKIGETWVSETILFNIVKGLFPSSKAITHYRSKWLEGLELDIYLPEKKLAFEYQGIQHFVAVDHWGGRSQLQKQQEHDRRKVYLCENQQIQLIHINYDDPLTVEFVRSKVKQYLT